MRLNPSTLELTASVFGFVFRRRSASVSEVRNLRYVPSHSLGRSVRESCICYEDRQGSVKFGRDLDDAEAFAVIDQMLNVYPFTKKDRALDYMDLGGWVAQGDAPGDVSQDEWTI